MKLGKLLGAGRSFFGWQESFSYRENKQVYLPKFNPGNNPFGLKSKEVNVPVATAPCTVAVEASNVSAPVAAGPVRQSNWTEKLNPFRGSKPAKAAPVVPMPSIQSELSLGAVKVVHNDLSDADVEVVPMKSRTEKTAASPAPSLTSVPMEFLGEPVFKSV
jgi:hypothetical protein